MNNNKKLLFTLMTLVTLFSNGLYSALASGNNELPNTVIKVISDFALGRDITIPNSLVLGFTYAQNNYPIKKRVRIRLPAKLAYLNTAEMIHQARLRFREKLLTSISAQKTLYTTRGVSGRLGTALAVLPPELKELTQHAHYSSFFRNILSEESYIYWDENDICGECELGDAASILQNVTSTLKKRKFASTLEASNAIQDNLINTYNHAVEANNFLAELNLGLDFEPDWVAPIRNPINPNTIAEHLRTLFFDPIMPINIRLGLFYIQHQRSIGVVMEALMTAGLLYEQYIFTDDGTTSSHLIRLALYTYRLGYFYHIYFWNRWRWQ